MEVDVAVQGTNDDASECKRSAVSLGYWNDPYLPFLVKACERRAPEINRGYYARVRGVELLIEKFYKKAGNQCQIVNLGSGFDTLYWRLKDKHYRFINFVELDFPSVASKKCYYIKRNKQLLDKIYVGDGEVRLSSTDLHAGNYHIVGVDLRNLKDVIKKVNESEINFELPTLFLAECVLVYIETPLVHQLLSWISSNFTCAFFINYEQVNMDDKFGEVMMRNLRARGCPLAGVDACLSLDTQRKRFLDAMWDYSVAWSMVDVYGAIPPSERSQIEKLEFLDEQELIMQLFQHYCIAIAMKGELFHDINIV